MPNFISLFTGVGMLDYGLVMAGCTAIAQVEIDEYCRMVLEARHEQFFPCAKIFADVRQFGREQSPDGVGCDLIIGGFPCQPHSVAGKRLGEADSRDLWGEIVRLVGEFRPRAIMLENVPNVTRTIGMRVISDLTLLGYDCGWGIISAADVGAPHIRNRWWLVGYARGFGLQAGGGVDGKYHHQQGGDTAHYQQRQSRQNIKRGDYGANVASGAVRRRNYEGARHQSRMGGNAYGVADWVDKCEYPSRPYHAPKDVEPPRTVAYKGDNWASRIHALGNGAMWRIAYLIGREIKARLQDA